MVLAEVDAPPSLESVSATWDGKSVAWWREGPLEPLRALLGIDLARSEGTATLEVSSSDDLACSLAVEVRAGDFVERRLQVPRRYVVLSPSDQARARREAERLTALFATQTPERLWEDAFRLPLQGAEPSDNFGQRRILNGEPRSPHTGVDFDAPKGTPVLAAQRGRVAMAATLFFSGRTVVLDHGLGLYTFYGHLSEVSVRPGQMVKAGARLGRVGATGRVTGPHLHWAVRLHGARVNPLELVALLSERPDGGS